MSRRHQSEMLEIEPRTVFAALGSPETGRIIEALADRGPLTIPQLMEVLRHPRAGLDNLLWRLRQAGLVETIGPRQRRRHCLIRPALGAALVWLERAADTRRSAQDLGFTGLSRCGHWGQGWMETLLDAQPEPTSEEAEAEIDDGPAAEPEAPRLRKRAARKGVYVVGYNPSHRSGTYWSVRWRDARTGRTRSHAVQGEAAGERLAAELRQALETEPGDATWNRFWARVDGEAARSEKAVDVRRCDRCGQRRREPGLRLCSRCAAHVRAELAAEEPERTYAETAN